MLVRAVFTCVENTDKHTLNGLQIRSQCRQVDLWVDSEFQIKLHLRSDDTGLPLVSLHTGMLYHWLVLTCGTAT